MSKPEINILISGGGTGGHIFPAISIANALKDLNNNINILFVGALGRMEMEKVPAAGYKIIGLPIRGFQRKLSLKNLALIFKLMVSLARANRIIKQFKPHAAVGVGGYASGPVLRAANRKHIPTLLQEQNSYAGVTNKLLARRAKTICVAYEGMEKYFPKEKIILTGNPVRKDILATNISKKEAALHFKVSPNKPVVLIIGGSLGARTINRAIRAQLKMYKTQPFSILWQTGKLYFTEMSESVNEEQAENIQVFQFISRMDYAYALADVVISRAGAGTISELCLVEKPVILIPSPNVAEDHQTKNAMALVNREAAILVPDDEAINTLAGILIELMQDESKKKRLKSNISKLGLHRSAERIADEVLKLVNKS